MDSSTRVYRMDRGTISICRNYVGAETAKDMVKRRVLRVLQNNAALTQDVDSDIIRNGLKEPHYRRA